MLQWSAARADELSKMELLSLDEPHEIRTVSGADTIQNNYELLEYTGLKDNLGYEGHEGDLVKMFNRSLFCIVWDEYYARFQLDLVSGEEHRKVYAMDMLQFGEVVGNIYANPELVPGGQESQ